MCAFFLSHPINAFLTGALDFLAVCANAELNTRREITGCLVAQTIFFYFHSPLAETKSRRAIYANAIKMFRLKSLTLLIILYCITKNKNSSAYQYPLHLRLQFLKAFEHFVLQQIKQENSEIQITEIIIYVTALYLCPI